jgi:hypothetical protein
MESHCSHSFCHRAAESLGKNARLFALLNLAMADGNNRIIQNPSPEHANDGNVYILGEK